MTQLSDFPPDVQAAASSEAMKFVEWLIPAPHDYAGSEDVLAKVIARAIMADRTQRIDVAGLTTQQANCLRAIAAHQAEHGGQSPLHVTGAAPAGAGCCSAPSWLRPSGSGVRWVSPGT